MVKFKRGGQIVIGVGILILLLVIFCNSFVILNSNGRTYDDTNEIPSHHLGLLLGTFPITPRGIHNGSFDNRIKAAAELYKAGKIKKLIVRENGTVPFMPYLLQSSLEEKGGVFEGAAPWTDKVVVEGQLITGQNPMSALSLGKALLEALDK